MKYKISLKYRVSAENSFSCIYYDKPLNSNSTQKRYSYLPT